MDAIALMKQASWSYIDGSFEWDSKDTVAYGCKEAPQ